MASANTYRLTSWVGSTTVRTRSTASTVRSAGCSRSAASRTAGPRVLAGVRMESVFGVLGVSAAACAPCRRVLMKRSHAATRSKAKRLPKSQGVGPERATEGSA